MVMQHCGCRQVIIIVICGNSSVFRPVHKYSYPYPPEAVKVTGVPGKSILPLILCVQVLPELL